MSKPRKILVITDRPQAEPPIAALLRKSGHEVNFEKSVSHEPAADTLRQSDVVVMHTGDNGRLPAKFVESVQAINPTIPLLVVSSHEDICCAVDMLHAGAFDYLPEGLPDDQILTRMDRAFKEHDQRVIQYRFHNEFRVLLENIPDIVFALNSEFKFSVVSESVTNVLGYKPTELIGKTPIELMPEADRKPAQERLQQAVDQCEQGTQSFEMRLLTKIGDLRHFEVHRRLSFKPDGSWRIEGVARDCTERIRLEAELRRHTDSLEATVRERTDHVERASEQLSALNKVSIALTQYSSEDKLLDDTPDLLTASLGFDRAILMMLDDAGDLKLRSICAPHDDPEIPRRFRERLKAGEMPKPPHYDECIKENKTVFIPDLNADPRWPRSEGEVIRTKAIVIVPLRIGARVVGVLTGNMQHRERPMDQQDIQRMETFTNMVGLALDNIRSYRALEDKVIERTRSLQESKTELEQKNRDLDELLYQVRQSSEELQAILNSSQSSILMVGNDGVITSRNNKVRSMFGLVEDPIRGTTFADFKDRIAACFQDQDSYRRLMSVLQQQGSGLYRDESFGEHYNPRLVFARALEITFPEPLELAIYSEEVRDHEGAEIGRVWIFEDIGPAKRADSQLRIIIDASPVPVIVARVDDGKILYANQPLCDVIGVKREEVIGKRTPDFYMDPADRDRVMEELHEQGYVRHREIAIKHADGGVRWMLFSLQSTELSGEQVTIGGLYDITRRKESEVELTKRLRYEEALAAGTRALLTGDDVDKTIDAVLEKLRVAAETTSVYMFKLVEVDGKRHYQIIYEVNAPDAKFIQWDDPDLHLLPIEMHPGSEGMEAGVPFTMNLDTAPDDLRELLEGVNIRSVLNLPVFIEDEWYGYLGFVDEQEVRVWSDDDIRLLKSAAEMIGVFIYKKQVLIDLENANRKIRETQSQLVQSEKMASLGMLVAGVAHEINTPVGALSSMHNTLVRAVDKLRTEVSQTEVADNKKIRAALKVIEDANKVITNGADRVATIVRRLRSFARLDQAEMQKVNVHDGIEDTLTLVHHQIKNKIKVHREFADLPPIVCYPGQLNQVFLNIIVNAVQAMPDEGEITIRTYAKSGKAYIELIDNGPGIPEKTLARIFDPGFTTKGVGVGTGLGLAICYQIMQEHRGEILAESEVGKGTKFTVIVPMNLKDDNNGR